MYYIISNSINSKVIECVGPEILTFKQILEKLLLQINKKRILLPLPTSVAELQARFFELLPNPMITRDQLKLLKYDNIASGKYKTNSDIGLPSLRTFDREVKKYSYMWKDGGQFSTEKYSPKNNLEEKIR